MKAAAASQYCREKHEHHFLKKLKYQYWLSKTPSLFFFFFFTLACLTITTLLLFHHRSIIQYPTADPQHNQTNTSVKETPHSLTPGPADCDLFQGRWVADPTGPSYTNDTCATIPVLRNCLLHGRKDRDFLHWRWKPDGCDLPRFRPEAFLATVRGRTMAFIGDSLARNQMESLLCLLSQVEIPKGESGIPMGIETDPRQKFTSATWEFREHNFTLMALWSQFLVAAAEKLVNGTADGSFHLHLDRVDPNWSEKLPSIDYAVFSDGQWFPRPHYLYEGGNLIGCVYCNQPNETSLGPGWAIGRAFRAAFKAVNECKNCKKIMTFLRTFSPSHFENGAWNAGGGCNRTWPVGREEVDKLGPDFEYRRIQAEEVEIARKGGSIFEEVDVTEMMSMRPDAHPGLYLGGRWMKGHSDCVHWCLPGPIDVWSELLFELIKRRTMLPSEG